MEKAYLFAHYKNAEDELGEQVYFCVSKDGYNWESINNGNPVIECTKGEKGARDVSIVRTKNNHFIIVATDLCMAKCFQDKYDSKWQNIGRYGSPYISMWNSKDLVNWSEQTLISLGNDKFGCYWGPEVIYDEERKSYVIYWASSHQSNGFAEKALYYAKTLDFETFSEPTVFYTKEDGSIVDPNIWKVGNSFYRVLKSRANPFAVIMEKADSLFGSYHRVQGFDECMKSIDGRNYEAPFIYQLSDGKWCMMLDYFGENREMKGYVPFIFENLDEGKFVEASEKFSFPYGFKHGNIIRISLEEYNTIKNRYDNNDL